MKKGYYVVNVKDYPVTSTEFPVALPVARYRFISEYVLSSYANLFYDYYRKNRSRI